MTTDARELKLYIDNDGTLYGQMTTSILKNLVTKRARGDYKHDLAVKAFGYLVEAGAKKYAKDFGSPTQPWNKMFDVATRRQIAEQLTRDFEAEAKLGNYDNLLPKKYQTDVVKGRQSAQDKRVASTFGSSHARKKVTWKTPAALKVVWSPVNSAYFALWPAGAAVAKRQVLKVAGEQEMHDWLRDRYGHEYGRVGGSSSRATHAPSHARKKTPAQLNREIAHALRSRRGW